MKLRDLLSIVKQAEVKSKASTCYICGGLPRDKYLNRLMKVDDVDFTNGDKTINNVSIETYKLLNQKYKIKREIKRDGHSTIEFKNMKIDFSSNFTYPNIEKYLYSIGIKNPSSLQKETYSRDFGCNSLLLSFDFKTIEDPTNRGIADCDNKIIRTVVHPKYTFYPFGGLNNRAIRSIYLACKLDFTIDSQIIEYIKANPQIIESTEPKSLAKKLNAAYTYDPEKTVYYLNKMNLWNYIPINDMFSDEVLNLLANRVNYEKK